MTRESVEHFGVVYDEKTDWRSFLNDVLSGRVAYGLDIDRHFGPGIPNALGELSEALHGTPMAISLADAALEVIERGDDEQMRIVESTGWENAPNAFERVLRLVRSPPHPLSSVWLVRLYGMLLRSRPTDARVVEAFTRVALRPDAPASLLSLASRYNVDWLVQHLPSLRPPVPQDMWHWVYEAGTGDRRVSECDRSVLDSDRGRLLGSIAALGEPYVSSLVSQVAKLPPKTKHELTTALSAQPAFSGLLH